MDAASRKFARTRGSSAESASSDRLRLTSENGDTASSNRGTAIRLPATVWLMAGLEVS